MAIFSLITNYRYLYLTDWKSVSTNLYISPLVQVSNVDTRKKNLDNISGTENVASEVRSSLHLDDVSREIEHYCNSPLKPVTGSEG